ncbi:MAG: Rha family transcriptional regulator [Prevotella sp.]
MNELVFRGQNDQVITSSRIVAEVFGKLHSDVVRAADKLLEKSVDNQCNAKMQNMIQAFYEYLPQPNGGSKKAKYYIMNRDGFTLLAMGFTGAKALEFKIAYIEAFNKMEAELKNQQTKQLSPAESLVQYFQLVTSHDRLLQTLDHDRNVTKDAINKIFGFLYEMKLQIESMQGRFDTKTDRYTVIGYCKAHDIDVTLNEASVIGGACSRACKRQNISVEPIKDPRFGKVNTYPAEIIAKAIEDRKKKEIAKLSV